MNVATIMKVLTVIGGIAGTVGGGIAAGLSWPVALMLGLGSLTTGAGALQMRPLGKAPEKPMELPKS